MNELELLDIAVQVAADAAETARRMRAEAITDVGTKSSITDVVTAADRAVEQQVITALAARRPGDTVLGEEYGGSSVSGGGVRWIVDPIDGTVNYLYGLPLYAVSLAAEVDGQVVAGVVRNAATGETWTAALGHGAWHAGRRLAGSPVTDLSVTLLGTGFAYGRERRAYQAAVAARVLPRVRDIRRLGAAAIDLCLAADGQLDAFYEKGLNEWDVAAGGLIAREAGLLVTGLDGRAPGPEMILAAPPGIYDQLHDLLAELDAAGGP